MSILIKGMRMPENCIKCPMQFGGMCYVMPAEVDESRVAPTVEEALKQGKPDWCPLVEIHEPHGDLIDRDAFRADFSMGENCDKCGIELKRCEYDRIYTKMDFCGWLDDAPTIIEAEGSEDDADN